MDNALADWMVVKTEYWMVVLLVPVLVEMMVEMMVGMMVIPKAD
jgi:hypothetical protein